MDSVSLEGWQVMNLQRSTHVVSTETAERRSRYYVPNVESLIKGIIFRSAACANVNLKIPQRSRLEYMGLGNIGS